jgi:hypothetical protein
MRVERGELRVEDAAALLGLKRRLKAPRALSRESAADRTTGGIAMGFANIPDDVPP